jgi:hypothetical protein
MGNVRFRLRSLELILAQWRLWGPIADVRHDPVSRMTGAEVIAE